MEKLDHETSEAFERARDANGGADFNEDSLGRVDVNLELACFIDRRIEKGQEALKQENIRYCTDDMTDGRRKEAVET